MKKNCWEHMKCGREPGGLKIHEHGICAAAEEKQHNGRHGGTNAGRNCWHVNGTLCGGAKQGSFFSKANNCIKCDFFQLVKQEEGDNFQF